MQGLYKLALVGTQEQLTNFLKKVNDGDSDSVFNTYAVKAGTGLRTTQGHGLQKFLNRYKLVIENDGSGNIGEIEPMADEIGKIAPDLEVVLLTQYVNDTDTDWYIYYKPAGAAEPSERAGQLYKQDMSTISNLLTTIEYSDEADMSELLELITDKADLKKFTEACGASWEDMEEFLALLAANEGELYCDQFDILKEYFEDIGNQCPYVASGEGIPPIEYLARLFSGNWGLTFNVHYRFHPETFDERFAGKVFVITGEPDDYGKDGAKEIIERFGGVVRGAISGKTDYLLVGAYAGDKKLTRVHELGIATMDTDAFEQMIS